MRTPIDGQVTGDEQTGVVRPLATRYAEGTVLSGKYRLEALLGEGGMGVVWRANNVLLDLPVAIKLIRADLDGGALRARLQLEARAAAKLGHSSIVRVFDVGESELGDPFIVMEHLCGETLARLISRGPVPAPRAVQLLLPIIDALAAAHARGIVHRDLKPDNVMIALEGQRVCPKILDFGIAKLTDARDTDFKLTEFGAVVGSPEYMSPEQARGREDIDASTDVWSTCVVLYEAITGSPPFSASNCNALLRKIVEDAPKPISEYGVDDAALWQILERGLRKDRTQRYAKITELGQALAWWLMQQGVTEDACGSTLDSKWLGRKSDPMSLGRAAPAEVPKEPAASPSRDSVPDSTGIARGPFTKTILPKPHARTRKLSAVFAAPTLVAACWLMLGRWSHATQPGSAASTSAVPKIEHSSAISSHVTTTQGPAASSPPSPPEAPAQVVEVRPESQALRETEAKPKIIAARPNSAGSSVKRPPPPVVPPTASGALAASSTAATAQKSERPLDLLAPY